jgi:hypothetical protein
VKSYGNIAREFHELWKVEGRSVTPHGYEVDDLAVAVVAGFVCPTGLGAGQTLEPSFRRGSLDFLSEWLAIVAVADVLARMAEMGHVCRGRETPGRTACGSILAQRPLETDQPPCVWC